MWAHKKAPGSYGIPGGQRIPLSLRERLDGKQPVHHAFGCRSAVGSAFVFGEAVGQHPCQHTTSWSAETQQGYAPGAGLVHFAADPSRRFRTPHNDRDSPIMPATTRLVSRRVNRLDEAGE